MLCDGVCVMLCAMSFVFFCVILFVYDVRLTLSCTCDVDCVVLFVHQVAV